VKLGVAPSGTTGAIKSNPDSIDTALAGRTRVVATNGAYRPVAVTHSASRKQPTGGMKPETLRQSCLLQYAVGSVPGQILWSTGKVVPLRGECRMS
jgi:hypothetical protein